MCEFSKKNQNNASTRFSKFKPSVLLYPTDKTYEGPKKTFVGIGRDLSDHNDIVFLERIAKISTWYPTCLTKNNNLNVAQPIF